MAELRNDKYTIHTKSTKSQENRKASTKLSYYGIEIALTGPPISKTKQKARPTFEIKNSCKLSEALSRAINLKNYR